MPWLAASNRGRGRRHEATGVGSHRWRRSRTEGGFDPVSVGEGHAVGGAASAAAVVVVTTISRVLTAGPSPIGPAMLAYDPYKGLTPTSKAQAIPSGTLAIAPGTPATASWRSLPGSGRSDLTHLAPDSRGGSCAEAPARTSPANGNGTLFS
jgi:hypothetical protein